MQMTLLRSAVEVLPQIAFECEANGNLLTATVTHKEEAKKQIHYLVRFSNGHEGVYTPGEGFTHEGFGHTRTLDAYEEAIFDDLRVVPLMPKGDGYTCVRVHEEGGGDFNVWLRRRDRFYSAFYNGCYQFTLCKLEEWVVSTAREKSYVINLPLARLLTDYLDTHPF